MEALTLIIIGVMVIIAVVVVLVVSLRMKAKKQAMLAGQPPVPPPVPAAKSSAITPDWLLATDKEGVQYYVHRSHISTARILPNRNRSRYRLQLRLGEVDYYTEPTQTESEAVQQLKTLLGF